MASLTDTSGLRTAALSFSTALLSCLLATCLLTPDARGQGESGRASITGRVADQAGGAIPNATVKVIADGTGQTRTLQSDEAGLFSFPSLLVGSYTVEVMANGFAEDRESNVLLTVGATAQLNVKLKPGATSDVVVVNADDVADITHRTETDNATTIDNEIVENLPTRGRNFTDFALLTPGISQELDRFGLVVNGQRSGNSNVSIDGVDFNDPLQNGQRGGPTAVYFFPQVAVREFQVVRTGLTAEVGRTNAGFINVVTKSGTNRYHGEAVYTNRNPWLTWPDALNDPEATNNQNQFAFGIGGPILRDRLFFYAGVEKTEFEVPFFVRIGSNCPTAGYYDPSAGVVTTNAQGAITSYTGAAPGFTVDEGCAQGAPGVGTTPLPAAYAALETNSYGLNNPIASAARVDWQINPSNTMMAQYMSTFLNNVAYGVSGVVQTAVSNNTTFAQQSQAVVLGLTTSLSSTRTNDARVQWVYDNRQQVPNSSGPEYDIGDFLNIGGNAAGIYKYRAIREELLDNYSWLVGKHSLRAGFDINLEPETQQREDYPNGLWTIDTFQDYLKALPVAQGGGGSSPSAINAAGCGAQNNTCAFQFQQSLPYNNATEPKYQGTQREFAGYIADNFHVVPRLTLNLGFRYDAQLEPAAPANPAVPGTGVDPNDITMWQPRLGVVWDPRGNGSTVIRASTGLYDARTPAYILARDFTDNGAVLANLNSNYNPAILSQVPYLGSFGSYSGVPASDYPYILDDVYTNNPAFKNPRSLQAAAAVEQAMTKRLVLVIAFTQNETWKLQHRLNTNLYEPTVDAPTLYPIFPSSINGQPCVIGPTNTPIPCRPNTAIAGFHQNYSTAHSTYRGMTAQLKGQVTRRMHLIANFTWASSRDDDSNERDASRELALDSLCVSCYNRGYSKQDIRNQYNMAVVYRLPLRFTFSSSFITRTALPYSAQTSGSKQGDFNNDGNTANDRPILCSQVAYTVCPLSSTQINAASAKNGGNAEVGTVVGRDTFRQDGFLNWDMRMIKSFRFRKNAQDLQFSAECLNCSRSSNLNLGANEVSKFTHSQTTFVVNGVTETNVFNPLTGYYYSGNSAGKMTNAFDTFRSGGPRQIQLGARFFF